MAMGEEEWYRHGVKRGHCGGGRDGTIMIIDAVA